MTKKFEEQSMNKLLELIGVSDENIRAKGAEEIDIVYTALDEIMTGAVEENWLFNT